MRGMNTFFVLGSVGVAVTALIHILVASLTANGNPSLWFPLYAVWMVFTVIGVVQMKRQSKHSPNN